MRSHRGLVFGVIAAALTAGVLTSAFVRPEAKLAAAETCYGPCNSVTLLSLSRTEVFYGDEHDETFTVFVLAGFRSADPPTGTVAVKAQTTTLCTATLHHGIGTCSPAARALPAGFYRVAAVYGGNSSFGGSTSARHDLTVLRGIRRRFAHVADSRARVAHERARLEHERVRMEHEAGREP